MKSFITLWNLNILRISQAEKKTLDILQYRTEEKNVTFFLAIYNLSVIFRILPKELECLLLIIYKLPCSKMKLKFDN